MEGSSDKRRKDFKESAERYRKVDKKTLQNAIEGRRKTNTEG